MSRCKHGYNLNGCELGHPGCICDDEATAADDPTRSTPPADPTQPPCSRCGHSFADLRDFVAHHCPLPPADPTPPLTAERDVLAKVLTSPNGRALAAMYGPEFTGRTLPSLVAEVLEAAGRDALRKALRDLVGAVEYDAPENFDHSQCDHMVNSCYQGEDTYYAMEQARAALAAHRGTPE